MLGFGFGYNKMLPKLGGVKITPTEIFGANLYDWWDFTDLATQSISGGGQIHSITSKGTNGAVFGSSGTERPASIVGVNGLNVADFDGVNDFMQVGASTGMYNFLHNGSLGTVIMINKIQDLHPGNTQALLNNNNLTSTNRGYGLFYSDASAFGNSDRINTQLSRGIAGQFCSNNITANDVYSTQQYNLFLEKVSGLAAASDRSAISINGGSEIKNNIQTNGPSVANATNNLTLGRQSAGTLYLKGQYTEIIILKDIHPTPTQITQLNAYLTNKYGSTFPII